MEITVGETPHRHTCTGNRKSTKAGLQLFCQWQSGEGSAEVESPHWYSCVHFILHTCEVIWQTWEAHSRVCLQTGDCQRDRACRCRCHCRWAPHRLFQWPQSLWMSCSLWCWAGASIHPVTRMLAGAVSAPALSDIYLPTLFSRNIISPSLMHAVGVLSRCSEFLNDLFFICCF